jgi:hypothetical protein
MFRQVSPVQETSCLLTTNVAANFQKIRATQMKNQVGKVEGSGEQVTINAETGEIVEGVPQNGTVELLTGERVLIKDGRFAGAA